MNFDTSLVSLPPYVEKLIMKNGSRLNKAHPCPWQKWKQKRMTHLTAKQDSWDWVFCFVGPLGWQNRTSFLSGEIPCEQKQNSIQLQKGILFRETWHLKTLKNRSHCWDIQMKWMNSISSFHCWPSNCCFHCHCCITVSWWFLLISKIAWSSMSRDSLIALMKMVASIQSNCSIIKGQDRNVFSKVYKT